MWIFILLLAMVPIFFLWSEKAVDLVPGLSKILPKKQAAASAPAGTPESAPAASELGGTATIIWERNQSDRGYVATLLSVDGQYRLLIGCGPGESARLQVAALSGQSLPAGTQLVTSGSHAALALLNGVGQGEALISRVVSFEWGSLLMPGSAQPVAYWSSPLTDSGRVASELQHACL